MNHFMKILVLVTVSTAFSCAKSNDTSKTKDSNLIVDRANNRALLAVEFAKPLEKSILVSSIQVVNSKFASLKGKIIYGTKGFDEQNNPPGGGEVASIAAGSKQFTVSIPLSSLPEDYVAYISSHSALGLSDKPAGNDCADPSCSNEASIELNTIASINTNSVTALSKTTAKAVVVDELALSDSSLINLPSTGSMTVVNPSK